MEIDVLNYFDIGFILAVICLTYTIIKIIDYCNGDKVVPFILKRVILVVSIFILGGIYILIGYENKATLINSAIASPVVWSWLLKPLCAKLGIDYKTIEDIVD